MNSMVLESPKLISELEICEASKTIAILIKLFPTRMEARSCSGSERSFKISWAERFLLDLSDSISFGSSENRATSEPEIIADNPNNIINTKSPVRASNEKGKNSMWPSKAPAEDSRFVSNSGILVIRMEDHRVCFPDLRSRKEPEVR